MVIHEVRKRDGSVVAFDREKIASAVRKASRETGRDFAGLAESVADQVALRVSQKFRSATPSVEDVQNEVESVLIDDRYPEIAKAYILYREKRKDVRDIKTFFGVRDDLKLGITAVHVLERRYLLRDEDNKIMETPGGMFRRVAKAVAAAEKKYGREKEAEDAFYEIMANLEFLPNSPTLMNAGTRIGQLSACFVLPVGDSIDSIFSAVKDMALIHQSGGGTGFSFSKLRPEGDIVKGTHGVASGPVSFMRVFDTAADVMRQGGKRRGANMGVLNANHPDIEKFILSKSGSGMFRNFNLSVALTDDFMKALSRNGKIKSVNPRSRKAMKSVLARQLFDMIVESAWRCGDPGILFIDEINRKNTVPGLGRIESTNPCAEAPLLPYESCNLGSVNLSRMTDGAGVDWSRLGKVVRLAVRFLDDVIDVNKYPLREIEKVTKANRKIGLGVMGFADLLIELGIPYDSQKAVETADSVMKFVGRTAREESELLGRQRGSFPNKGRSIWSKHRYMRNATVTAIAPTGTISIIAGCSSGIEPIFGVTFMRNILEGSKFMEVNPYFERAAKRMGFYSEELMIKIARFGTLPVAVPEPVRRVFVTSGETGPEWHVKVQAAFQKHTDLAVSKTVNLPENATHDDVRRVFLLAHKLGCKGVTVYRSGSVENQVLTTGCCEA
jgi:ribonucleoside-diphosphate reductase alpha chain